MGSAGVLAPGTQAPAALTVLYDGGCRVCLRARNWLAAQPSYVPLYFLPAGSELARGLFPQLDPRATLREVTVVGSDGAVYRGSNAWIMCLWALRRYRPLAYTLSTPALAPRARRFIVWISRHRNLLGSAR